MDEELKRQQAEKQELKLKNLKDFSVWYGKSMFNCRVERSYSVLAHLLDRVEMDDPEALEGVIHRIMVEE